MPEETRNIEWLAELERIRYLKQCCKGGQHAWGLSASDQYEICTRSWCGAVRKKEQETRIGAMKDVTETQQRTSSH